MKYKVLLSIILLTSFVSYEANSQVPARQWETYIEARIFANDFLHGKRIAQYENTKSYLVAISTNDSLPTFAYLDSTGILRQYIVYDYNRILYGQYRAKLHNLRQTTLMPFNYSFAKNYVRSTFAIYDTNSTYLGLFFYGYQDTSDIRILAEPDFDTTNKLPFTTIEANKKDLLTHILFDTVYTKTNDTTIRASMNVIEASTTRVRKRLDSVCSFNYTTSQFPLIPYPFAVFQEDTNSYYVLHAPDTLYLGTTETGIRITKHYNQDFHLEETYIPDQHLLFSTVPNDPNPYNKKYVPKFHSVSTAGYVIVGNALDSLGSSTPIIQFSRFDNTISYTKLGSRIATINSCRVRDDGTVVAVGTTKNGIQGSEDFYMIIVRPDGGKLEEYVWGGAFDDNLADVTYTDNGDIVVSGNAGVNCYVARIATDNPTSVNESVPFSSSIGFAPNPASSQTLVRFAPTTDGIATAELFDMRGMKVKQLFSEPVQRGNEYTFPAPVADVPNGVYTVIITNGITKHHQQLQIIR